MGLHYLTVMGRNLENKTKMALVQIMNIANMNGKNILNNINIFNESAAMNSDYREQYWDEQCFLQILLG